jgi:hypothetical protein
MMEFWFICKDALFVSLIAIMLATKKVDMSKLVCIGLLLLL